MARTLVVVPIHNGLHMTLACLRSLEACGQPMTDVLVVDNGSTDDSAASIRAQFPKIRTHNQDNRGYGAAANVGLAMSFSGGYDYTWVLNNDTTVPPGTLEGLVEFMERPENRSVGACSPIIYLLDQPERIDFAGGHLDRSCWSAEHESDPALGEELLARSPESSFLTGCAVLLRNEAIRAVGEFDEQFFMYWEDVDMSVRLLARGWGLRIVRSAHINHRWLGSSGGKPNLFTNYYSTRNRLLIWRKHARGTIQRWKTLRQILQPLVFQFPTPRSPSVSDEQRVFLKSVVDGLLGLGGHRPILPSPAYLRSAMWICWIPAYLLRRAAVAALKLGAQDPARSSPPGQ